MKAQTSTYPWPVKYRAIVCFYGNTQVSPWFGTAQEAADYCKTNGIKYDAVDTVANFAEVARWQADPAYPAHYEAKGPWPFLS